MPEYNSYPTCPKIQDRLPPTAKLADFRYVYIYTCMYLYTFLTGTTKAPFETKSEICPHKTPQIDLLPRGKPTWRRDAASPQVFLSGTAVQAEKRLNKWKQQRGAVRWLHAPARSSPMPGTSGRASPRSQPWPLVPPGACLCPAENSQPRFKIWECFCLLSWFKGAEGIFEDLPPIPGGFVASGSGAIFPFRGEKK